jgi:hypothetical protein
MPTSSHEPEATPARAPLSGRLQRGFAALLAVCVAALSVGVSATGLIATGLLAVNGGPSWP